MRRYGKIFQKFFPGIKAKQRLGSIDAVYSTYIQEEKNGKK